MNNKAPDPIYGVFVNKNSNKKLVYYPCPKNANSSAKLFFIKHLGIEKNYIFIGDKIPLFRQSKKDFDSKKNLVSFLPSKQPFSEMPENFIKCCIVRDPLKRFVSAYKNRILFHNDKNFYNHSIDEVITKLELGNFENKHFLPQSFFLGNNLNYYDFYADVENIKSFIKNVNNFFENNLDFPKIQTGGSKIDITLNDFQISKIKKIYEKDYEFLKEFNF